MQVRTINAQHEEKVAAALEAMLKKVRAGRMPSLLFIAEEVGRSKPVYGMVGRFRADPARALGHLAIMKVKVTEYAADESPSILPDD